MSRDATTAFARTLVDEWVRARRHRRVPRARVALGAARARARRRRADPGARAPRRAIGGVLRARAREATGRPAVVLCTSGTAAANFHPAVLEAHHGRVPLIVCTADRPPELRDTGAGQTIDQVKLFGDAVRWFHEAERARRPTGRRRRVARAGVARGRRGARVRRPGRCTCNLPFREPLVPTGDALVDAPGRSDDRPWTARAPGVARAVGRDARRARRTSCADARAASWSRAGARASRRRPRCASPRSPGWPVLADPSRTCGCPAPSPTYDPLLRGPGVRRRRTGPTSCCASARRSPASRDAVARRRRSTRSWSIPTVRGSTRTTR